MDPVPFRSVRLADLPLRTLREVSSVLTEVSRAGADHRAAIAAVFDSPRTPFVGVFLVAVAVVLIVAESLDA